MVGGGNFTAERITLRALMSPLSHDSVPSGSQRTSCFTNKTIPHYPTLHYMFGLKEIATLLSQTIKQYLDERSWFVTKLEVLHDNEWSFSIN